jgi:hypothetical protein
MWSELLGALKVIVAVQATQAAVRGTIRDSESGAPLAGAIVTLTDLDLSAVSDSAGRYRMSSVPAGPQHLTVRRIGYSPRTLHALVPGEGEVEIDLALPSVAVHLPTIVVRSGVAIRGAEDGDDTAFPDRGISAAAIRNSPLLAEPDGFLALSGGEVVMSPESPSGINVRGGAADQTAYLLDGVPVFSPYHAAGTFSAWNPDALERLGVTSASPTLAPPDALSGSVQATTRQPGEEIRAQGSLSTAQGRVSVHGPLGATGVGFLLSARAGVPGVFAPENDASYLRGRTGDLLGKLEVPVMGGRFRLLTYDSRNRIDAVARAEGHDSIPVRHPRNDFAWNSRSVGAEWSRSIGAADLQIQGWNAGGEAEAGWNPADAASLRLESDREDQGLVVALRRATSERFTGAAIRVQHSRTDYRVVLPDGGRAIFARTAKTPIASVFVQHQRAVAAGLTADLALSVTGAVGGIRLGPQAELRWRPARTWSISGSYIRSHQYAQSLRNSESVVGGIFPADLYLGAGAPGVPVARGDRAVLAADLLARPGIRLGAQAYLNGFDGVVLVAPRAGDPFATGGFTIGSGTARGVALEAAVSGARYGVVASYGWQRVRVGYGDTTYTPSYGTNHLIEGGVIVFPTPTTSIRLGATGALGRRTTAVLGSLEWESCNLRDQGCEFGGSPTHDTGRVGATRLPGYLRLDLGVRKHWHLELAGRDVELALFGTMTNLLAHRNVLSIATDPLTGERSRIEMRPLAPLVAGLDWRF